MAYYGLVTKLQNLHKDPNSDRLYLAECFHEGVIVGPDSVEGEAVLYLPTDGKIERWFGDAFTLFRKNEDGTPQGGYIEDNSHIRAIKLRGNQSAGVVIPLAKVYEKFGDQGWNDGDKVTEVNGKVFCSKYIPKRKRQTGPAKTSYKGKKAEGVEYPEFDMHADTAQLAYNLGDFHKGDIINMSLKIHGTSQRSMRTKALLPNGFFRRLFHLPRKEQEVYVCGTRRTVITKEEGGFYGSNAFRLPHHEKIAPFVEPNMEVFAEIVGYYGEGERDTIMPIVDNTKLKDKAFTKQYGPETAFTYGCKPGESKIYVYRITANNGEYEFSPAEIVAWCKKAGVDHVPYIADFEFTTEEDLLNRINTYFEDLTDPVGKTHIKEGVVIRILNRRKWTAYKSKTYEFKVLEGLVKETSDVPDMEEAQEV